MPAMDIASIGMQARQLDIEFIPNDIPANP